MLAWVRTATSLITFGLSVYKFFQIVRPESERTNYLIGARQFGILLVSIAWLRSYWRRWNTGRTYECWTESTKAARARWRDRGRSDLDFRRCGDEPDDFSAMSRLS